MDDLPDLLRGPGSRTPQKTQIDWRSTHLLDGSDRPLWYSFGAQPGTPIELPTSVPPSVIAGLFKWDSLPASVKVAMEALLGDSSSSATL